MSEVLVKHSALPEDGPTAAEMRGLCLRLDHRADVAAVPEMLFAASEAGYNTIIVDTFFDAATIFPSAAMVQAGLSPQRPALRRSDILDMVCREARELDLSVYANVDVRVKRIAGWRTRKQFALTRAFTIVRGAEPVLCINRRDVRNLIGSVVANISERYPLDGIVLSLPANVLNQCPCRHCTSKTSVPDQKNDEWPDRLLRFTSHLKSRARKGHPNLQFAMQVPMPSPFIVPAGLQRIVDEESIAAFLWEIRDATSVTEEVFAALANSPICNIFAFPLEEFVRSNMALVRQLQQRGCGIIDTTSDVTPEVASTLFAEEALPLERAPVACAIELLFSAAENCCSEDAVLRAAVIARAESLRAASLTVDVVASVYNEITVLSDSLAGTPVECASRLRDVLIKANRLLLLASA